MKRVFAKQRIGPISRKRVLTKRLYLIKYNHQIEINDKILLYIRRSCYELL